MKSTTNNILFLLILGILMAFTSLSTDVYLPAMPEMERDLQGSVELTVTGFLIGFALAQLIWGPISDRIGRKIPMFIGLILFIIGSVGCALAESLPTMVFWRIFQAIGACTAPMLSRAMVRDQFSQTRAVQMLSSLTIIMAVAPIIGPLLGGQMIKYGSWHNIFYLLAGIGFMMLLSLFKLPETLPPQRRQQGKFWAVFGNYRQLLANKTFMLYTLCVTFYYIGNYAFIIGSPKVYISFFGVDSQHYGWLFAINIVGVMLLSFINRHLVKRFSLNQLLLFTTSFATIMGLALAFFAYSQIGGIYTIVIAVFFYFSMVGIIASCATAAALELVPQMAGSGSALLGSLQYGSGIVSSVLLALFNNGTAWTMAWIMAVAAILSVTMIGLVVKQQGLQSKA